MFTVHRYLTQNCFKITTLMKILKCIDYNLIRTLLVTSYIEYDTNYYATKHTNYYVTIN